MKKKKIIKISVIALAVLLLLGGCVIGLPFLRGNRFRSGKFPTPDHVAVSMVENGEIVERELSRAERRELLKLFVDPISKRKEGVGISVSPSHFFDHYEQFGAVKFLYDNEHSYKYIYTSRYRSRGKQLITRTFNAIYFIVTEGYVYAYEVYEGTILRCSDVYFYRLLDRQELLDQYFSQKEG